MTFPLVLGSVLVALGLISLLIAWFHPSPDKAALVKALSWSRKPQDRTGIALVSVGLIAIGAFFMTNTPGAGWTPLIICGVVVLAAGLALGLHEPAV